MPTLTYKRQKMKLLIIEDEVPAANRLEQLIQRYNANYVILAKLRSVEAAVDWFAHHPLPDLLFLDIHLLDGTCFDLLKKVDISCPVIFTTAYDHYALDAFQLQSIDYLLKPISFAQLQAGFNKLDSIQHHFEKNQSIEQLSAMLSNFQTEQPEYKSRFLVKTGSRLFPIAIDLIAYFFSEDRISFLVTREGKKHITNYTLDEIEHLLDPALFFRINRQMIIQIDSIRVVHKYFKGRLKIDLLPKHSLEVMVSSRRVTDFQAWLDH